MSKLECIIVLHMMHHMGYTYTDILRLRANTRTAHTVFRAKETARSGVSAGRNGVGGDDDGPKNKLATPRHASVMMTDRRLSTSAIAGIRGLGSSGGYAPPAHILVDGQH